MLRHCVGHRPQLTFTADFRQRLEGDLIPGPCVLRYDPRRLLETDHSNQHREISARDAESSKIRAWLRFHPQGGTSDGTLQMPPNARPTEGFMLETTVSLPPACAAIEAWFSCRHADHTDWDNNRGRNYWLRSPLHDLLSVEANVGPLGSANSNKFEINVASVPAVRFMSVRWRLPTHPEQESRSSAMHGGREHDGRLRWSTYRLLTVPVGASVLFDLEYSVDGHDVTDDNHGHSYLAD